jgi:hypothetical protein
MAPSSISRSYLPAIAKHFDYQRLDNGFREAINSSWVQLVLDGFSRLYYRQFPEGTRRRRAFTAEFFPAMDPAMTAAFGANRKTALHRAAESLAVRMGVECMFRKSEYLPGRKATAPGQPSKWSRGLSLRDIHFLDAEESRIPLTLLHPHLVHAATVQIRFSKTDTTDKGRHFTIARAEFPTARDLLQHLVAYAICLRDELQAQDDRDDHCLFQVEVAVVLKTTVVYLGMDPSKYTPHSMRYGGATSLAAAGLPLFIIEYYGGWAPDSKTLKEIYIQLRGDEAATKISDIMATFEAAGTSEAIRRHNLTSNR